MAKVVKVIPNGDLFIEETDFGRTMMYNNDGSLRWTHVNKAKAEKYTQLVGLAYYLAILTLRAVHTLLRETKVMARLSLMLYLLLVAPNAMGCLGPGMLVEPLRSFWYFFADLSRRYSAYSYYPVRRFWQRYKRLSEKLIL